MAAGAGVLLLGDRQVDELVQTVARAIRRPPKANQGWQGGEDGAEGLDVAAEKPADHPRTLPASPLLDHERQLAGGHLSEELHPLLEVGLRRGARGGRARHDVGAAVGNQQDVAGLEAQGPFADQPAPRRSVRVRRALRARTVRAVG